MHPWGGGWGGGGLVALGVRWAGSKNLREVGYPFTGRKWDSIPAPHKCCFCPLASLPRWRRRCCSVPNKLRCPKTAKFGGGSPPHPMRETQHGPQGVPDHQVLPIGGAQHVQALCHLLGGFTARTVCSGCFSHRCRWGGRGRDALEGKGPQRRPQKRLDRRLEEVAKAVGGGYCQLQMPLKPALAFRGTVAGHRLGALEGDTSPPSNASLGMGAGGGG